MSNTDSKTSIHIYRGDHQKLREMKNHPSTSFADIVADIVDDAYESEGPER